MWLRACALLSGRCLTGCVHACSKVGSVGRACPEHFPNHGPASSSVGSQAFRFVEGVALCGVLQVSPAKALAGCVLLVCFLLLCCGRRKSAQARLEQMTCAVI